MTAYLNTVKSIGFYKVVCTGLAYTQNILYFLDCVNTLFITWCIDCLCIGVHFSNFIFKHSAHLPTEAIFL